MNDALRWCLEHCHESEWNPANAVDPVAETQKDKARVELAQLERAVMLLKDYRASATGSVLESYLRLMTLDNQTGVLLGEFNAEEGL